MAKEKMVRGNTARKLVDFGLYASQRQADNRILEASLEYYNEIKRLAKEEARREVWDNSDSDLKKRISVLERDCERMKVRLQNAVPLNMLLLFCLVFGVFIFTITTFGFQIITNTKIIDYYILFFVFLMSFGLLCTSIYTIICWKRFLGSVEEERKDEHLSNIR